MQLLDEPDRFVMDIADRAFDATPAVSKLMDAFDALEREFEAVLTVACSFQSSRRNKAKVRWNRTLLSDAANGTFTSCECVLKKGESDLMEFDIYCCGDEFRIPSLNFRQGTASDPTVKDMFRTVVLAFDPLWASCRNEGRFDLPDMNMSGHSLTIPVLRTFTYFGKRYSENVFHGAEHVEQTPGCLVESFSNGFLLDFSAASDGKDFQRRRNAAQKHLLPYPIWGADSRGSGALSDALYFGTSFEEEVRNRVRVPASDLYGTPRFREDLAVILARVEERLSESHLRRRTIRPMLAERNPQGGEVLFAEYRSYEDLRTLREMTRREAVLRSPRVICFVLGYPAEIEQTEGDARVFIEEVRDEWFRLRETFCLELLNRPRRLGPRKRIELGD